VLKLIKITRLTVTFLICTTAAVFSYCGPLQGPATGNPAPAVNQAQAADNTQGDAETIAGTWDVKCSDKGCMMFTDVLIGDPDHPADPKHPEYITIAFAINRSDRKPAYFAFYVPADADRSQGVIIAFAKNIKDGEKWNTTVDKGSTSQLDFNSCDQDSCVARVHSQILNSDGRPCMDLLDEFLHKNHILFLYTKKGEPYRAIKALFPFQRAYQHLMETELKPAAP
jgi:invasion protein IalB